MFMEQHFNEITCLTENKEMLLRLKQIPAKPVFDERMIEFLDALSKKLFRDKRSKQYADVLSYAFWIRRSRLEEVKKEYSNREGFQNRVGRGVSFHIAPSNVPVNFAVSFTSALLAGNACVVRVSNREFLQVDIICDGINSLYKEGFKDIKDRLCIIRYGHKEEITQAVSNQCDIRIIWGGNRTIDSIRRTKLPPRAIEMAFADRYSLAVIHADEYMKLLKQEGESYPGQVAEKFYTDTYYTDQNACSSPRIVVWIGEQAEQAKKQFWEALSVYVHEKYALKPIQAVDKMSLAYELAARYPDIHIKKQDNYLVRVEVNQLQEDMMEYKGNSGYFLEYTAKELKELLPILGKTCQTISYLGIDKKELLELVRENGVKGVDRIVPIGKTMELSFTWDGYDMIETMSRMIGMI